MKINIKTLLMLITLISLQLSSAIIGGSQGKSSLSISTTTTTINSNFTNFTQLLDSGITSYSGLNNLCLIINETLGKVTAQSCSSASGDITSVTAGTGLFGGGLTGAVTLNVSASTCSAGEVSKYNGTGFVCVTDSTGTGNASWNQSFANGLYSSITWGYNQTQPFTDWLATFLYNYNQTTPAIDHYKSNPASYYNVTTLPASSGNASWNQSFANTLYQAIGSYLLVSDLPLTNRTISHWDNVTNKPANLDIDSTNDLLITDLPLHNRTLVNCLNITGSDPDFCNDAIGSGSSYKGDGIYLYNDSTTMYFNQTKENITINSLIDLDELHYNTSIPDQSYTDTKVSTANLHLHNLLNLTGTDDNACSGTDKVSNVTIKDGVLSIVCTADVSGAGGDGTGSWINDTIQTNTSVNVNILTGHNISANWFKGNLNWSDVQNEPIFLTSYTETDPIWSANFTNMQIDCPNGNYSYGVLGNGTLKCRSDTSGTGIADFTNVAYLNNTQTFSGQNTFRNNITFKDWNNQAVLGTFLASNTTAWYWSFGNPTGEYGEGNYFKVNDTGMYDGTTIVKGEFVYNHTTTSNSYTDTKTSTANLHLHNLLNLTGVDDNACSSTDKVINVTINNGVLTIVCSADLQGAGGGNPFNQVLNTTSNVTFAKIILTYNNTDYDQIRFINLSGSNKLVISSEPTDNYLIGGLTQTTGAFSSDFIYPYTSVATIGTSASRFVTAYIENVSINKNLIISNTTGTSSSRFYDNGSCTIWVRGSNEVRLCG